MDLFNLIGKDVIIFMMKYLQIDDIARFARCCKEFHTISQSEILWIFLLRRDFKTTKNHSFDVESMAKSIYQEEIDFKNENGRIRWFPSKFEDYISMLRSACRTGNVVVIRCCIRKGIDVDQLNMLGDTYLMEATRRGHINVVKILLDEGADINKSNDKGYTSLSFACAFGRISCAELLIKRGADINKQDEDGWTPLMVTVLREKINIIFLLLKHGVNINQVDKNGYSALDTENKKIRNILLNFSSK